MNLIFKNWIGSLTDDFSLNSIALIAHSYYLSIHNYSPVDYFIFMHKLYRNFFLQWHELQNIPPHVEEGSKKMVLKMHKNCGSFKTPQSIKNTINRVLFPKKPIFYAKYSNNVIFRACGAVFTNLFNFVVILIFSLHTCKKQQKFPLSKI